MDQGWFDTEMQLHRMEKKIRKVYEEAQKEAQAKLNDYLRKFEIKDRIKRRQLREGKITREYYNYWRKGQICIGERWREMVDALTKDYVNADKIAMSIIKGHMPEVYALNHNYATFQVEQGSLVDTSYTLYNRHTVENLMELDQPSLLPAPKVNIPKDEQWNKNHIRDAITKSVLKGDSIPDVAKSLQQVTDMDYRAAVRNARTIMTGVQNSGRLDAYKRAESMGINLKKEWLATPDAHTRDSHRWIDGEIVGTNELFSNGLDHPGDPYGKPAEVYNCRCTMVPVVDGIDPAAGLRENLEIDGMSYEEWKNEHRKYEAKVPNFQTQVGKATTIQQVNDLMNSQEWFRKNAAGIQSMVDLTGCDLESAKSVAASYQQVFEKFPQLKGKFDAPNAQPANMNNNTYAWCYIRQNGMVQVNPASNRFGNWSSLVRQYESDVVSGWHPKGTTAESIVTHEIGHAIDGLLARQGILGGMNAAGEYRYASSSLRSTIMKRAAKEDTKIAEDINRWSWDKKYSMNQTVSTHVSQYGAKDPQEWLAECFAEYITSANPRTVARLFGEELEKLVGRVK
jgi:SPP1 gp7 family putative phage head morphogenesis protein